MTGEIAEPWDDRVALHVWLHRLLAYILEQGPTTDDAIARYCLRPAELVDLAPEAEKAANAEALTQGLAGYLDTLDRKTALSEPMERWRHTAMRIRETFSWPQLAPVVAKRAHKRAELLVLHCQRHKWLIRYGPDKWRLTESGLNAVDHFWTDGVRPNPT